MIRHLVLYPRPRDLDAFLRYYEEIHVPLTLRLPGIKSFEVDVVRQIGDKEPPYWVIANATWESWDSYLEMLKSREFEEARADIPNYAPDGCTTIATEIRTYL